MRARPGRSLAVQIMENLDKIIDLLREPGNLAVAALLALAMFSILAILILAVLHSRSIHFRRRKGADELTFDSVREEP